MSEKSEPTLRGTICAICLGPGGIPKQAVEEASVEALGLVGDAHRFGGHGGEQRAICLFSIEDYESLRADGVTCQDPGAFGENVLTEGIDFQAISAGDRLALGEEVVVRIEDVRVPCKVLRSVDPRFPQLMVGRSGFVASVEQGGTLRPGTTIRKLEA